MPAGAAIGAGAVAGGVIASKGAQKSAKTQADAITGAANQSEALNRERYGQAERYLNPYLERELQASNQLLFELGLTPYSGAPSSDPGSPTTPYIASGGAIGNVVNSAIAADPEGFASQFPAPEGPLSVRNIQPSGPGNYRSAPGYAASFAALDTLEEEGIDAVNQGAANTGSLYSGRRGEALRDVGAGTQLARAQTENQFYNNYMNILQNLASPASTTNLSSLGVNQAATIGSQNIAAQNAASGYSLQGTAARNAATADAIGGAANLGAAYLSSPQYAYNSGAQGVPINQSAANSTGTITPNYAYL